MRSINEIDLSRFPGRSFFESPAAWEDEVLYFLMLDRFSDGREDGFRGNDGAVVHGVTPPMAAGDPGNAVQTEAKATAWREAGGRFVGGTLEGLTSKIGYLERLGVTAIWVSPPFRQAPFEASYHGYGIQNFLDVDPRAARRTT
jgi:glycosidase